LFARYAHGPSNFRIVFAAVDSSGSMEPVMAKFICPYISRNSLVPMVS
jgi:hypothetical protein